MHIIEYRKEYRMFISALKHQQQKNVTSDHVKQQIIKKKEFETCWKQNQEIIKIHFIFNILTRMREKENLKNLISIKQTTLVVALFALLFMALLC
ncbi:CLUMA_CG016814, isoform A [Clunio marinus]|uniref:CLUMA_CG016814, isoform A n=1 Tax=Clunio marinus TaxID=568069 RepID=A0A1J1ITM8_9DIPT|nr:CLUMA_CG016814, isoform A [Clunio marinus]